MFRWEKSVFEEIDFSATNITTMHGIDYLHRQINHLNVLRKNERNYLITP